ncbi:PHP domain-containing protein [Desulfitobacterium metallireducens]|uniref:Histidinol phosphatase n=1 Tax=Desulfitobacterium metallireducens DSM 15288 TaxID=871968 RepID=W0EB83_9FIRM|nr:PHP domain-containing protein [Desulfitobacterium metallireducens]AHF06778.1 histidinol phosphatase [Desulfitobacterium metallireducens DSM 15288]
MFIDLHVHTEESDGALSVEEVLKLASERGIEALSLTDHETTHGVELAQHYIDKFKLKVVPGVELVTAFKDIEVHLLGYFGETCLNNLQLQDRLKELRLQRTALAYDMVKQLQREGLSLKWSEVEKVANPEGTVSKGHIMHAIHNHFEKSEEIPWRVISALFQPGGAVYLPFLEHSFAEAVDLIYACGGMPVLAHPGLLNNLRIVNELLSQRPIGLEVYYGYWEKRETLIREFEALGGEKAILITGGSDFHGPFSQVTLGQIDVPYECLEILEKGIKSAF